MEQIDVIFYINLEHRTDRKEHFLSEIKKLCTDETKVVRIDAIQKEEGIVGRTESHIKSMATFDEHPEWKTCIIFEDDFTFTSNNLEDNNTAIRLAMTQFPDWDVISLGYNHTKDFIAKDTHEPSVKRIVQHQKSSGYILTKKFMPILATNFTHSLQATRVHGVRYEFCLDIYWRSIQSDANWYCVSPALGYEYVFFSDTLLMPPPTEEDT